MEKEMELKKGDWIVHKQYGVGEIEAIVEKKINGKGRKYFRVKINNGAYWLPIKKVPDYIRSISSHYKIQKVLRLICKAPQDLPKDYRARNSYVTDQLVGVSIQTKGRMIRDLHARGPNEAVNLTVIDSRQLESLRKQFLCEMAAVLEIEMNEAEEKLDKALEISTGRI